MNPHSRCSDRLCNAPTLVCFAPILFATLTFGLAAGASATGPAAQPVCSGGEYRELDFWIGDWDTFDLEQERLRPRSRAIMWI